MTGGGHAPEDAVHVQGDEAEDFQGTARFKLQRRLGAGSFGVVYEAYDREHEAIVALKVLRAPQPDAIARFKREFRTLADLTHANLVGLHELAFDAGHWFFTMERVEGVTLLDHARGESSHGSVRVLASTEISPLSRSVMAPTLPSDRAPPATSFDGVRRTERLADPERLRHTIAQLASGLAALHAAGKLHRDVKPSNALVTDGGRVVLLDFGLATELVADDAEHGFAGTPAYAAPEQIAGGALTEACDLYAVGVILFEALTGRLPFDGELWKVVAAKTAEDAPDVRALAPEAPEELCALCMELLAREPSLRPSADAVVRRIAPNAPRERWSPSSRAPFVGRARELGTLAGALEALERGEGGVAWIHGPSGVGKTALVRRLLDQARARGATVLAGRCYEQERLPYKTLDGVVDALVERWARREAREYAALLPADTGALTRLFPALLGLAGVIERGSHPIEGEPHEIRRRAFGAMRELLGRVARHERLVVFVDDLQWGDTDGALLLGEALRSPAPPLLFVGTFREDSDVGPAMNALRGSLARGGAAPVTDVALSALSEEDTATLAAAIVPGAARLPREALLAVVQESEGLPFLVGELVRLAASGKSAGASNPEETTVQRVVRARLDALTEDARVLLRVVALAGQPVPRAVVRDAAAVGDEPTAFSALRGAGLVRTTASGALVETYHDRIRETVLGQVPADVARGVHGALATALEARGDAEPSQLAHHFEAAGRMARASLYAERAADRASEAFAFDRAASLYARAREMAPDAPRERTAVLLERRGDAIADAGRSAEAAAVFESAAEPAEGDAMLRVERKAAEHWLRSGHIERGVAASEVLLAKLGVTLPRSTAARIAWLAAHRAWLALRGLDCEVRPAEECDPRDLLRYDMVAAIAISLSRGDALLAVVAHVRSLELVLALGEPSRLQRSLFSEACYALFLGQGRSVDQLRVRMAALALQTRTADGFEALPAFEAIVCYFTGQWREARDRLLEAERHLVEDCRGVAWEIGSVRTYVLASMHFLGDLKALVPRVDELVADAVARDDSYLEATLRVTFSFFNALVRDDPARGKEEIALGMKRWGLPGFTIPHYWAGYAEAEVALYEADGAHAREVAEQVAKKFGRTLSGRVVYLRALTAFLRGRAAIARAIESPEERASLLRFVEARARDVAREDIPWSKSASRFLQAAVARMRGDATTTARLLEEVVASCDEHGFALDAAIARRALGVHAGDDAKRDAAEAWMRDAGIVCPAKMARTMAPGLVESDVTAASRGQSIAPRPSA